LIRAATPDDLPGIAGIQGTSGWSPPSYLHYDCRVAVSDGFITGFLVSRQTAPGEREILNLAVHPSFRRRGIARSLLEDELARSRGAWFLEVRESNLAALALYESMGFHPSGRRPDYYLDPPESAIVMRFFS
jgi:[ribosomal protein S18]-alanine N-acetyltransferase